MEDRIVQYPNRVKLVPVAGATDTYDIQEVPGEVTSSGTPLSKATLMTDVIGERYGLPSTGTISQMFEQNVQEIVATVPVSGWSATPNSDGWYTNRVNVAGMKAVYNPLLDLVVTSAAISEDERSAFSCIIECETFDGYVIFRVVDVPDMDINVRFLGV